MQEECTKGKKRDFLRHFVRRITPFVILGLIYFVWLKMTQIYIPCAFRFITGCKCPGCGITTMCVRGLSLDFTSAFYANPFIFLTLPFIIFEIIYCELIRFRNKKMPTWNNILILLYCLGLVIFAIVRNIL